ncbi:TIGR02678 family protein [Nonomuraea sp. K274]|uniref:TIGR02678 family protein n=1 Tax=Nonomuraea cypriaca TaxID=1187855 RepID=A0A931F5H8_9ACTN|nr:TIGR02678 family protein [Nonomuraea cypriaca]MBF8192143.1 TIGR02678 family protein [Nonomuraea cypriaca]
MSRLANQLVREEKEQIARAIRTLLGRPLVSRHADQAAFELIVKRRRPLTQWFDYFCGWRLVVEPRQGYARLLKIGPSGHHGASATRPARRRRATGAPFDRRRYTLFCLCAAELLTSPVTTIGMLAQRVVRAAGAEAGVPAFDPVRAGERAAFADALKLLEHYGVITAMDGTTDSYLADEDAKVLYQVDTTLLVRLLAVPVPPSRITAAAEAHEPGLALTVEARYGGEEPTETQRNLWARHSFMRRLLDEPVVYRDELTPAQADYAASSSGRRIMRRAAEEAGFVLEERAEGFLLVDPDATATDGRFPDDGSHAKVAALFLIDLLVSSGPVTAARLDDEAAGLLRRFPQWAKGYQSDGGAPRLAADALEVLALFGLARRTGDQVAALPAAARYRVDRGTALMEDS